ncbi:MAG: flagellar biosynthetic protein FliO [Clostridium sp.]
MEPSFVIETIKMICIFAFVIVLMILTLRGLSKYQNKIVGNKNIKVLERTGLSQNTTLNIVRVGEKFYLISATSSDIKILKELETGEINEALYNTMRVDDIGFNRVFKNAEEYVKRFKGKGKDEKKSS